MVPIILPIAAAAAAGALAHGAFYRNSRLFGHVISKVPDDARAIALTFDDGPNPYATSPILAALREAKVPATFFLLGRHVDRWPALACEAADDGHTLGNHGYAHRKLTFKTPGYTYDDIMRGRDSIERATGVRPNLFRAPHGFRSPWTYAMACRAGQRMVGWGLGVWDSERPPAEVIAKRVVDAARPGMIVLLHDGDGYDPLGDREQTALALPSMIGQLRANGFTFVAL